MKSSLIKNVLFVINVITRNIKKALTNVPTVAQILPEIPSDVESVPISLVMEKRLQVDTLEKMDT